ncbi:unnamed protein product [Auanema sp. JU1783]|nr:unnamed protein product [Auanema sp. JU1783]
MPPKAPKKKLHELAVLLPEGTKINDPSKKKDYVLGKQFATGGFGRIYTCKEVGTKEDLVVKVEPSGNGPLFTEVNVFQRLLKKEFIEAFKKRMNHSWIGLPYIISGGVFSYKEEKLRYMIIPKYDMSLEGMREKIKVLSFKNTWEVSHCVLQSLEYVHEKQFTHADIKAANILLEKKNDCTTSVLVDFGLARFSANNIDKPDKKRAHNGTAIFTSSDAHIGNHPSFRGDIEILAYNILYWLTGSLPWLEYEATPAKVFDKKQAFIKDVPKSLKDLLKSDSASIEALTVFFEVVAKTSYTQQVNFKSLFNAVKKALGSSKGKRLSPAPESKPVSKAKKAEAEDSATSSTVPKRRRAAAPTAEPTPTEEVVSTSKTRTTTGKSTATKSSRRKSPIQSDRIPIVSPVMSALKNIVSPRRVRSSRRSPPLREAPIIQNQKVSPVAEKLPIDSSKVTTRRKFTSKPISPSIKACPQKLLEMVPGVRNFERNRRSLVLRNISKNKYTDMANENILYADYPLFPLPEDKVTALVQEAHDWAHAHGLVYRLRQSKDNSEHCQTAPIALIPTPFPRSLFQQAVDVQNLMASLYHDIAYDFDFLTKCHEEVVKTDSFIRLAQKVTLAIQRSDYMAHKDPFTSEYCLKQIEVNNIASSMGGHSERVTLLHRRTLLDLGYTAEFVDRAIPKNKPIEMIADALFKAWTEVADPDAIVLVIVEDINQNQIDQRHVEYALEAKGIPVGNVVRQNLTELHEHLTLTEERRLNFKGSRVSVVYFRSGYSPDHYPTEKEWAVRLVIERSDAIKSPWIGLQVANTKKTQQVLSEDGVLEKYIGNPRDASAIRDTFAGLWALEDNNPVTRNIIKGAISHPERFVLKPQLEGGAGNYYGNEISEMLEKMSSEERGAFILMERVRPLAFQNYLVRAKEPVGLSEVVSELGIYGYALGVRGKPETGTGGHLLRTKGEAMNEGGVAVGASVIDSPFLYELL